MFSILRMLDRLFSHEEPFHDAFFDDTKRKKDEGLDPLLAALRRLVPFKGNVQTAPKAIRKE